MWWAQVVVGTNTLSATVLNLSEGGALLRASEPLGKVGRLKLLLPPFGEFDTYMRWSRGKLLGIQFTANDRPRVARTVSMMLSLLPW